MQQIMAAYSCNYPFKTTSKNILNLPLHASMYKFGYLKNANEWGVTNHWTTNHWTGLDWPGLES